MGIKILTNLNISRMHPSEFTRTLTLIIMLFDLLPAFGQLIDHGVVNKPIPPSPNAASILKFVDIPSNNYVGTPNISIPIYEIKGKDISLPISLSYQSFGFKVAEIPGWCGMGWTLNAGGVIGRTIVDLPDEYATGYQHEISDDYFRFTNNAFDDGIPIMDSCTTNPSIDVVDFYNRTNPTDISAGIDTEPDIFSFSTPSGKSGKFVFDKRGQVRLIPKQAIQVFKTGSNLNDVSFQIADDNGTFYDFTGATETVHSQTLCDNLTGTQSSLTMTPISSWFLTTMHAVKYNEQITLSYLPESTHHETISQTKAFEYDTQGGTSPAASQSTTCTTSVDTYGVNLATINFENISVVFTRESRTDLTGSHRLKQITVLHASDTLKKILLHHSYFNGAYLQLDSVVEFGTNGARLPSYKFDYHKTAASQYVTRSSLDKDHWGFFNAAGNTSPAPSYQVYPDSLRRIYINFKGANKEPNFSASKEGVLEKITYPTGGYTALEYEPHSYAINDYEWPTTTLDVLATTNSPVSDGAYVDYQDFTITEEGFVEVMDIYACPTSEGGGITANCGVTLTGPEINWNSPSVILNDTEGALMRLAPGTYRLEARMPTMGSTVTDVMGIIKYKTRGSAIYEKQGGGIRLKIIKQYGGVNTDPALSKKFEYVLENGATSGKLMADVIYHTDALYSNGIVVNGVCINQSFWVKVRSVKSESIKQSYTQGSAVGYDRVIEYSLSPQNETNGKSVYEYTNYRDTFLLETNYPTLTSISNSYKNGLLLKKSDFRADGQKIRTIVNKYVFDSFTSTNRIWGFQTIRRVNMQCIACDYLFSYYHYTSSPVLLDSAIEISFAGTNALKTFTKNEYMSVAETASSDRFFLPRNSITTDSKGKTWITENKYPYDFRTTSPIMDTLFQNNIYQPVWMVLKDANEKVYDGRISSFKKGSNDQLLMNKIFRLEVSSPIDYSMIGSITNPVTPNAYFREVQKIQYSSQGDIISLQKKDDYPAAMIWLNDLTSPDRMPISVTENALPSEIYHTSFETSGTLDSNAKTGKKSYSGDFSFTPPSGFTPQANSILSYWYWSNGSWIYKQVSYSGGSTVLSDGDKIDEVRIYPPKASMTTYTYDPGNGITSTTDQNNTTTYYKYDGLHRVESIVDKDGNILKTFRYHYARENAQAGQ